MTEPVLIVRPDDDPIGPKHVALYVLLMVTIDVLDANINTMSKLYFSSIPVVTERNNPYTCQFNSDISSTTIH